MCEKWTPTRTTDAQLLTTLTLPAGYVAVSVSPATLWITFAQIGRTEQRGRERSLLPASGDATQLLRTGTFKSTGHFETLCSSY